MKALVLSLAILACAPFALAKSNYTTIFATYEEASQNCEVPDDVSAYYDIHFQFKGWVCNQRPINN